MKEAKLRDLVQPTHEEADLNKDESSIGAVNVCN